MHGTPRHASRVPTATMQGVDIAAQYQFPSATATTGSRPKVASPSLRTNLGLTDQRPWMSRAVRTSTPVRIPQLRLLTGASVRTVVRRDEVPHLRAMSRYAGAVLARRARADAAVLPDGAPGGVSRGSDDRDRDRRDARAQHRA